MQRGQTGQWIWNRADIASFQKGKGTLPGLQPAVFIATIGTSPSGNVQLTRALSPSAAGSDQPVAMVVRFDDSLHRSWDRQTPEEVASSLAPLLATLLTEVRASDTSIAELQLDYDAPVRCLASWAAVMHLLKQEVLHGVPVWVTSLPAHIRDPDYGGRLRGIVDGHILQLFDTGLPCSARNTRMMGVELERHQLAFRIGVAAFERQRDGATTTDHRCWLHASEQYRRVSGFAGFWMFGAGQNVQTPLAWLEGINR